VESGRQVFIIGMENQLAQSGSCWGYL